MTYNVFGGTLSLTQSINQSVCASCVDVTEVIDIATVTDRLRTVKPDCGWLMLVDGHQKLNDRDFTNAAELLGGGTCSFLPRPFMHMYLQPLCHLSKDNLEHVYLPNHSHQFNFSPRNLCTVS